MRFAFVAKMIGDVRHLDDNRLLVFELRVQHAQRIRIDAPLRIRAKLIFHFCKFFA